MKVSIISCLIIYLVILSGCNKNLINPEKIEELIPLRSGNYWLYRNYTLNADGSGEIPDLWKFGFIIDSTLSYKSNGKSILSYKVFVCGEDLKPFYNKPEAFEGSKLVYQNGDGLYYSGTEKYNTVKVTFNDLIFPYPAVKDRTVQGHIFYYHNTGNIYNIPDEEITEYSCVSTDSLITTPSGNFKCIVFKMPYNDLKPLFRDEVYYFIKPGLGIVAMVTMVYHYSTQKYSYMDKTLLTDYKIN